MGVHPINFGNVQDFCLNPVKYRKFMRCMPIYKVRGLAYIQGGGAHLHFTPARKEIDL